MDSSIVDDLAAEQAALDDLVRNLDEEQWAIPSPAAGWNVRDEIAHLAFFDDVAVKSISGEGEARFAELEAAMRSGDTDFIRSPGEGRSGREVLAWWREARAAVVGRIPWDRARCPNAVGAQSNGGGELVHRYLMETWAHGLDCFMALGVEPWTANGSATVSHRDRAIPNALSEAGVVMPAPLDDLAVEVCSPTGDLWRFGHSTHQPDRGHRFGIRQGRTPSHETRRCRHPAGDRSAGRIGSRPFEGIPVTRWDRGTSVNNADMLISDILARGRTQNPNKLAILGEHVSRTYSELADRVEYAAGALSAAGMRPHDRMAILAANEPGVVEICLATSMIGAVVVPLNPRATADDIAFQADDADVGFAFVQAELEPLARAGGLLDRPTWLSGEDLENLVASSEPYRGARPRSEDVLVQLYTSGTTARPKGCLLTHRGWLSSISGWAHATGMSSRDVVWAQLPLFHVAGMGFLFTTLATGATFVVDGPGDPARFWEVIRARSVTVATLFPNPFDLVEHPDAGRSLQNIRLAFSQQINDALVQSLPDVTIGTSYGATELGGMALVAFGDECLRWGPFSDDHCSAWSPPCSTTKTSPCRTARSVNCAFAARRRHLAIGNSRTHRPRCCATAGYTPATLVARTRTG